MASMNSSNLARSCGLKSRGFLLRRVISISILADMVVVAFDLSWGQIGVQISAQVGGVVDSGEWRGFERLASLFLEKSWC
jgi:hypothetical protein